MRSKKKVFRQLDSFIKDAHVAIDVQQTKICHTMVDIDRVLISVESVREKLLASVNQTWQQDVEQQLSREHDRYASYDDEQKFKLFLEYILHTDMRHYWKAQGETEQPWFVQVEQVQDISQPVKRRLSRAGTGETTRSSKRMLKMVLFDGALFMMYISCCHQSMT